MPGVQTLVIPGDQRMLRVLGIGFGGRRGLERRRRRRRCRRGRRRGRCGGQSSRGEIEPGQGRRRQPPVAAAGGGRGHRRSTTVGLQRSATYPLKREMGIQHVPS